MERETEQVENNRKFANVTKIGVDEKTGIIKFKLDAFSRAKYPELNDNDYDPELDGKIRYRNEFTINVDIKNVDSFENFIEKIKPYSDYEGNIKNVLEKAIETKNKI